MPSNNNNNKSTFKGIERIDKFDHLNEVLREALINAIVHRSYSFSGSIIININSAQIEFISTGGIVSGFTKLEELGILTINGFRAKYFLSRLCFLL